MRTIIKKYRLLYILTVILSLLSALFMTLFSLKLGEILDGITIPSTLLAKQIVICILVMIVWFMSSWSYSFCQSRYVEKILLKVKDSIFKVSLALEFKYSYDKQEADLYNEVTKNTDLLQENYLIPSTDIVKNIFSITSSIIAIVYINWQLALLFLGVSLITIFFSQLPGLLMKKATAEYSKSSKYYLDRVAIILKALEQIKLLQIQDFIYSQLWTTNKTFESSRRKYQYTKDFASNVGMFLSFSSQLLCMTAGIYFVRNGFLTIGSLIASVQLLNGVFSPLQSFINNKNLINSTKIIFDNIQKVLDTTPPVTKNSPNHIEPIKTIRISNLTYEVASKRLFNNLSLEFHSGRKYAIIGDSGKGKSTLAKLILNYYPSASYKGEISINGKLNDEFYSDVLYKEIAFVQKNTFVLDGSVLENILFSRNLTLNNHLLDVLDFQSDFLNKSISTALDTISEGEKQRIDLARFLVKNYSVYIFDEPTSNLDPLKARNIMNYILSLENAIVIVITHNQDPSVLNQFDEVIHL